MSGVFNLPTWKTGEFAMYDSVSSQNGTSIRPWLISKILPAAGTLHLAETRDGHEQGWTSWLNNLEKMFA